VTDQQIAALKEPGGARREDLFDPRERAVLRFATLLTSHPGGVEQRDLDELGAHLSAAEAFELVVVIATANWTNRFNDGLGTPIG
jgi:alkylhydroperoxidase family enzyme